MVTRDSLQAVRIQLAAFADLDDIRASADLTDEGLAEHLQRLLMRGELAADCTVTAAGLKIEVHGLTQCGQLVLFRERFRGH